MSKVEMGLHNFIVKFFLLKKKIKRRTNLGPLRVSGTREQCKKQVKVGPYITTIETWF